MQYLIFLFSLFTSLFSLLRFIINWIKFESIIKNNHNDQWTESGVGLFSVMLFQKQYRFNTILSWAAKLPSWLENDKDAIEISKKMKKFFKIFWTSLLILSLTLPFLEQ